METVKAGERLNLVLLKTMFLYLNLRITQTFENRGHITQSALVTSEKSVISFDIFKKRHHTAHMALCVAV